MLWQIIQFFFKNRFITVFVFCIVLVLSMVVSPFRWETELLPSDPVPIDAIPDIGENQQIIFTTWDGRSPQDIEDQITYPLTSSLLGISGVKSVRSSSIFGMSSIYLIFEDDVEFYWSRSRILEKLNSLAKDSLPEGVTPSLGPDASGLGQIFWYSVEGRDKDGNPTGGWDLHEIRTVQDFQIKYALSAVTGVSEVSSIGGYVQEYQIDVNPDVLRVYEISLQAVMKAVQSSNRDIGAKTIEINKAEYVLRGLGAIQSIEDIENIVVSVEENVPIRILDIGVVHLGPASRRGILDKEGAEVVGGVVVARYGSNPMAVIEATKERIEKIAPGLPKKILDNGVESQLTIVPFYDRSQLIEETLGTLEEALYLELLITILVVLTLVGRFRVVGLISMVLPISVLLVFVAMKVWGVEANIVSLSGIAIAIGTMVDLGIILSENISFRLEKDKILDPKTVILEATKEVYLPMLISISTTIVSFIPIFLMENAEGKLFTPLAFTKTAALMGAFAVTVLVIPSLATILFHRSKKINLNTLDIWAKLPFGRTPVIVIIFLVLSWLLTKVWMPLGPAVSIFGSWLFVLALFGVIIGGFWLLLQRYSSMLGWCLEHRGRFLVIPSFLMVWAIVIWFGFSSVFGFVDKGFQSAGLNIRLNPIWSTAVHSFPGMGNEFMPALDEGAFLLMPSSMPHSGMTQNKEIIQQLDMRISAIPEVELAVGKIGRAESALDSAPISMVETIINIKPEYVLNERGQRGRYAVDSEGRFLIDSGEYRTDEEIRFSEVATKSLVADEDGVFFRNWREKIHSSNDIWAEIVKESQIPGVTSAPKLQPIETRLVMLQTGMRAPMGIKVYGSDLETIELFSREIGKQLGSVSSIEPETIFADRIIGKPYLLLDINRELIARYGLSVEEVQRNLQVAIGGMTLTSTIEGRTRFPVRVRYPRELRDDPTQLQRILISTPIGVQVPLSELLRIEYSKGPQMIRSEDGFLVGYVLFDKKEGFAAGDVVEEAENWLQFQIEKKNLIIPDGIHFKFSGAYENQERAEKRLLLIIPIVLLSIVMILFYQFRSVWMVSIIATGVCIAFSGAFILLWAYGIDGLRELELFGIYFGKIFQFKTINLSVAVWVGFIALFGIATDDGVLMGTFLEQKMRENKPKSLSELRKLVISGAERRLRAATMTSATTLIALLPVLTATGRGADIMIPMAVPVFGGMLFASLSYFLVPVLYSWREETRFIKEGI